MFFLKIFPGNLLHHTFADPDNPDRLVGRSEVDRRAEYFHQLEDLLPGGIRCLLVQLIKNCLQNAPSKRPTAEQLIATLKEMKANIEGSYGELARVDAVRQVMTVKALKRTKKVYRIELTAKDVEIQQLQQQLEVKHIIYLWLFQLDYSLSLLHHVYHFQIVIYHYR